MLFFFLFFLFFCSRDGELLFISDLLKPDCVSNTESLKLLAGVVDLLHVNAWLFPH